MTNLKQQLKQKYLDKQEELITIMQEFLERVVESAAERGVSAATINITKEEIIEEGVSFSSFKSFLTDNSITFNMSTHGDVIIIDLES